MEFGATANRNALLKPSGEASKQDQIKLLLGRLAVRRQAEIGKADYEVYSKDLLNQGLEDIAAACDNLAMEERQEGQTAFPSIALMLAEVGHVARKRRIAVAKFDRDQEQRNTEQYKREHPEAFMSRQDWKDIEQALKEHFGASRTEAK